ncbi:MAG: DUF4924 family protein [Bacteroidales bacterium]|nr:DUF4924 family protein [Bacteroidales bacterium]
MIIAREKKNTNIAEYILYMWQIEDMIRANRFDPEQIDRNIIQKFDQPEEVKEEMREWYRDLIQRMENEGIKEKGHLNFLNSIIDELENLHKSLIRDPNELEYVNAYNKAKASINDLKSKSQGTVRGDIEACLQGLYGILMLRIQKKDLNPATKDAQASISHLIAMLNDKYMERKGMQ